MKSGSLPALVSRAWNSGCHHTRDEETVSKQYHGEFPFTGVVHSVAVDLSGDLIVDDEAAVRQLMAQQ